MNVLSGMRNFFGALRSSVKNQPPTSTAEAPGLYNSISSPGGPPGWVNASLTRMGAMEFGGSSAPGEPPASVLARQLDAVEGFGLAFGSRGTSEKPRPSAATGHGAASSYRAERMVFPSGWLSVMVSPPLCNLPV